MTTDLQIISALEQETHLALRDDYEKNRSLDLSYTSLSAIPEAVFELLELKVLKLVGNDKISGLPAGLFNLRHLEHLDLRATSIADIPPEIENLICLQTLDLRFTGVTEDGFREICKVTSLKTLYLWDTKIAEIPPEIANLTNMDLLYIGGNRITEVPVELCTLTNLATLGLRETMIKELPPEFEGLTGLRNLYIGITSIKEIPPVIYKLQYLKLLHAGYNEITKLSPKIGDMISLESLYLNDTHITELPVELCSLPCLRMLNLSHSQVKIIPPEIRNLAALEKLNLAYCELRYLPKEITELPLEFTGKWDENGILVDHLELLWQDISFLKKGRATFRSYVEEMETENDSFSECKIIFLGNGEAGKTSLVRALQGKAFLERIERTNGIEIEKDTIKINGDECRVRMWDFGGQEINHSLHTMFMTRDTIYVIVLSGSCDEKPDLWLEYINTYAPDSPVIIVINKMDLNPRAAIDDDYYSK